MTRQTRTQQIVAALGDNVTASENAARLPSMLQRNGLLQTVAFARSRKDGWNGLIDDLQRGMEPFASVELEPGELANLPASNYLRHQLLAIEVAGWIDRLVRAKARADARAKARAADGNTP